MIKEKIYTKREIYNIIVGFVSVIFLSPTYIYKYHQNPLRKTNIFCRMCYEDELSNKAYAKIYSIICIITGIIYIIAASLFLVYAMFNKMYYFLILTLIQVAVGVTIFISVTYCIAGLLLWFGMKMVCQLSQCN